MPYSLSKNYAWKEIGDQVVILDLDSGSYYSLNSTASLIWKGIMSGDDANKIAGRLGETFEIDEAVAGKDTEEMIGEFLNAKMINEI